MKRYIEGVATQATAILLAALGAATFAFFQSMATSTGGCPLPLSNPAEVGAMGALIKGIHSAFIMKSGIMHV